MRETLVRLLPGAHDTVKVLHLRVEFAYGVPAWLVALLIMAAGAYCYEIYRREAPRLKRSYRLLLAAMRFLTWIAVILAVLQPRIVLDRMVKPKSNVAVLIDTSRSMTLVDKQVDDKYLLAAARVIEGDGAREPGKLDPKLKQRLAAMNRYQMLHGLLANEELALLRRLRKKYALRFFAFDKDVRSLKITAASLAGKAGPGEKGGDKAATESKETKTGSGGEAAVPEGLPPATGDVTQFGRALSEAVARLRGLPLAGIVAFTDGGSNKGEDPLIVARQLGKRKIPVFPVGLGAPQAVDVKVLDANIPELVFKDDELAVRVTFAASALDGVVLPVNLMLGDRQVGRGEVTARDGVFSEEFVIKPPQKGSLVFKVSVPQQIDEYFVENNVLEKRVRVIDNAIRILIVVDTPSWEYRYLKGFLNSDKRIKTRVLIRRGDLRRVKHDDQFIAAFPAYDELRRSVDCLIMNNIKADFFSGRQLKDIGRYVAEEGGSLIMISSTKGTPGTFIGTPVGKLLPVVLRRINEDASLDLSPLFTRGFKLRLTREGRYHVVTRLLPKVADNARRWESLPDQYWYYRGVERLKPTATALVEHSSARNEFGAIPIISIQRYGRGQVLFLAINSIWRWRYKIGNRMTNRFWGQTIQFMGLPHLLGTIKRVQFDTQGHDFLVGEMIPVTARVLTRDYLPVHDDSISLRATRVKDEESETFSFSRQPEKEGVFSGNIFLEEGTWNVQVVGHENEETLVLDIHPPRYEYEKPAMQQQALQAVATASGGRFADIFTLAKLPEWIAAKTRLTRSRLEQSIWDNWFTLAFITLTTAVEWILRKRKDLA